MGIVRTGQTDYDKEMQKWEQFPRYDATGNLMPAGNPYVYRPFPAMLYKAFKRPNGQYMCMDQTPVNVLLYAGNAPAILAAEAEKEAFTRSCQRIVQDQREKDQAWSEGWRSSPADALAYAEALEQEIAKAAAEANFAAARMSEKARQELHQAGEETDAHVVDIAGGSKKRGRPARKAQPVAPLQAGA